MARVVPLGAAVGAVVLGAVATVERADVSPGPSWPRGASPSAIRPRGSGSRCVEPTPAAARPASSVAPRAAAAITAVSRDT
jgi:hypothetical protein